MYNVLKNILFLFDPEISHAIALNSLRFVACVKIPQLIYPQIQQPIQLMGLNFQNPIGLAAGLDKNADYIDALAAVGFGFIEVGTITPRPQPGNPKPRLFRLPQHEALINRMGFNNLGIDHAILRLKQKRYSGVLGINIGKNWDTPIEKAADDYLQGFRRLAPFASYITINISSPNTVGLRDLQSIKLLQDLLTVLKAEQHLYQQTSGQYIPLVVKISPDESKESYLKMAKLFLDLQIDGVIATNTALFRTGVTDSPLHTEAGGLSGAPLLTNTVSVIETLYSVLGEQIPIIASGGMMNKEAYLAVKKAGAKLVQLYTGFIYHGPGLIKEML